MAHVAAGSRPGSGPGPSAAAARCAAAISGPGPDPGPDPAATCATARLPLPVYFIFILLLLKKSKKFEKLENFGTDLGWFGGASGTVWGYFWDDFGPTLKNRKFESSELKN